MIGLVFMATRQVRQKNMQIALLAAVGVALVALTVLRALV